MEKIKRKRARIGDVIEIPIDNKFAYAQYSHDDKLCGPLLRILPGEYSVRPKDFSTIVQQKERYFVFYTLHPILEKEVFLTVANEEVPEHAKQFPIMRSGLPDRSGKVHFWWLRDGEKSWKVEKLSPEQRKISIRWIVNDTGLIELIKNGWLPEHTYLNLATSPKRELLTMDESKGEQQVLEESKKSSSNISHPHSLLHYLYFDKKQNAIDAAEILKKDGYEVKVRLSADGENWLTLVSHSLVPPNNVIEKIRSKMESIASSYGGEYDGWEAEVTK